jgi:hypothetical protein
MTGFQGPIVRQEGSSVNGSEIPLWFATGFSFLIYFIFALQKKLFE